MFDGEIVSDDVVRIDVLESISKRNKHSPDTFVASLARRRRCRFACQCAWSNHALLQCCSKLLRNVTYIRHIAEY